MKNPTKILLISQANFTREITKEVIFKMRGNLKFCDDFKTRAC